MSSLFVGCSAWFDHHRCSSRLRVSSRRCLHRQPHLQVSSVFSRFMPVTYREYEVIVASTRPDHPWGLWGWRARAQIGARTARYITTKINELRPLWAPKFPERKFAFKPQGTQRPWSGPARQSCILQQSVYVYSAPLSRVKCYVWACKFISLIRCGFVVDLFPKNSHQWE